MAPLQDFSPRKVLLLTFVLLFLSTMCISVSSEVRSHKNGIFGRRKLLGRVESDEDDEPVVVKKKSSTSSSTGSVLSKDLKPKNQTKLLKSLSSSKNQTKLAKASIGLSTKNQTKLSTKASNGSSSSSTKDQTKLIKLSSESGKNETKLTKASSDSSFEDQPTIKTKLKKLNSTSKATNSTKTGGLLTKKSTDLSKLNSAKNKTEKATGSKKSKSLLDEDSVGNESKSKSNANSDKKSKPLKNNDNKPSEEKPSKSGGKSGKQSWPSWVDQDDDDDDLVSEFRTLPSKFQETLLPDLERISKTSKVYLTKANKEITRGFKPYVGNKYAPTIASFISFAFVIIPLVLVSLIFNKIKAYFSLQKILIFIQIYLSIYFSILCFSSLITGLEPLKFFYATSQSTYVCLQVLQTLGYVLYLLLLLMYLILIFSTETGLATKLLGLAQTFVGYAVGLHYYVTVFHMAVLRQPPKTSWKIHGVYATCFLLICVLTRAEYRRKKEYLDEDESKMS